MRLVYFAWVRERIGLAEEIVSPPVELVTIGELVDWLVTRGAGYAEAFADRSRVRAALDQEFVSMATPIAGAREIALFPPVTGG